MQKSRHLSGLYLQNENNKQLRTAWAYKEKQIDQFARTVRTLLEGKEAFKNKATVIPMTRSKIRSSQISALMIFIAFFTFLCLISPLRVDAETAADGTEYQLSEDRSYAIVTGYSYYTPTITLPSEIDGYPVKEIAKYAFAADTTLTSIVIPDSVTVIGECAFKNCTSLVSVSLPSSLTELPYECFSYCSMLKKITLPNSITSIDDGCFENCGRLGRLYIPSSVTNIGYDAFLNCESIYLDVSDNPYAADYAVSFNINTDIKGTSGYFWSMLAAGLLVALLITVIIATVYRAYLRKHPEKDPDIFIYKTLGRAYRAISRVINALGKALMTALTSLLWALTQGIKRLRYGKRTKTAKPPSDDASRDADKSHENDSIQE